MSLKLIKGGRASAVTRQAGGKMSPNRLQQQRNGLLALVHIAPKDLGMTEEERLSALERYGVTSSGALSIPELEQLLKYFESKGFVKKPVITRLRKATPRQGGQVTALQDRIRSTVQDMENGEARMTGLVKAKCGVDDLRFCRDVKKLKQVLRILTLIKGQGKG